MPRLLSRISLSLIDFLFILLLCSVHLSYSAALDTDFGDDNVDLSLSKEDISALGLQTNPDLHGDPLSDSLRNLGLTDSELSELKQMEDDTNVASDSLFHGKTDHRAVEAAPPPGMVAPSVDKLRRNVNEDDDFLPPKPHQPDEGDGGGMGGDEGGNKDGVVKESKGKEEDEEKEEKVARKKELDADEGRKKGETEAAALRKKVVVLERKVLEAKRDSEATKAELEKSKDMFRKALQSAKLEHRNEKEELTTAIEERKRAFDELYEEKQVLGQILRDEQDTLRLLQEKIQHPDLSLWIKQRAERASILMETPETDAMKFYARKYMAPEVTKMGHRLTLLEKRVEKSVDHLLPSQYGSVVALLLTIGLIGFPVFVTMSTVVSVTKSVSLRQYVLLGNVFLTAFSGGLCIAGIILQQDPLQTLYEASENMFVVLQLATAIAFPIFVGVIVCAVVKARDREDLFVFACELVFYILVGLNYRSRVWRPAMLGQNIETSRMMYVVYVIDFLSMTALTISSAKLDQNRLPSFVVADRYASTSQDTGSTGQKVMGVTGSTSVGSARSRLGSLGSNLVDVAISGENNMRKEE